jgi:hypothetical protein
LSEDLLLVESPNLNGRSKNRKGLKKIEKTISTASKEKKK